jgi:hypothetical protein
MLLDNFLLKGCSTDHYKNAIGNKTCQKCSKGRTNNETHTGCKCKEDRYTGDDEDGPCYGMYLKCVKPFTKHSGFFLY